MSKPALSSAALRLSRRQNMSGVAVVRFTSSRASNSACRLSTPFSSCSTTIPRSISSSLITSTTNTSFRIPSTRRSLNYRQRCAFSASAARPGVKVVQNPRVDDEGNTLMINISPRAAERLREITDPSSSPSATKEENPYHHLRVTVTSGGCHGFQYLMSLEATSKIDPEEDTVFEAEPEQGTTSGPGEAKVVMDEPSLELLSGSTVDYTMELIGSQFKIVDNPRATTNCGCGTSFDVKD
ncbi:iron-sulfur assembly protein 2 [Aspergillus udagawae]|uniref:Iron-sulfur assembly protein 2 n=2 Tax=Aspergillus udagawae TaxID=91492 RepID=A0A8H3NB91_9EURO|nr:iron-sulfur assembly protein 2 [Aspergillus udagawae]